MTEATTPAEESAQHEAVQAVVDRVSAWQHGATEGTVLEEVRKGFGEVGVEVDDDAVQNLVQAIESDDGPVDASKYLG